MNILVSIYISLQGKCWSKTLVTLALTPADIARVWILAFLAPFLVTTEDGGVFFTSPPERRVCVLAGSD